MHYHAYVQATESFCELNADEATERGYHQSYDGVWSLEDAEDADTAPERDAGTNVIDMHGWAAAHGKAVPSEEKRAELRLINEYSVGADPGQQAVIIDDIIILRDFYAPAA